MLLIAVLVAAAYGRSLGNGFVHDDSLFMEDERVQSLEAMPRLLVEPRWGFGPDKGRGAVHMYYRPLEPLPYALAHAVGSAPWPSHLLNLLFHFGNCLLVLALVRRFTGSPSQGAFAACLFAVYPAYSEAVLWPAALGGLGAFACTLALLMVADPGKPGAVRWTAAAALYLGAMWFKETGTLAPLYLFLRDWLLAVEPTGAFDSVDHRRPGLDGHAARRPARYAALLPPLLLYATLRSIALGQTWPSLDHMPFSIAELLANSIVSVRTFALHLLWPFALNFHHDFSPARGILDPRALQGAAILLLGLSSFVATRRRQPVFAFGLAAMLVAAAPYLVPHKPADNVFAERYLYDVGFGAALCLSVTAAALWRRLAPPSRIAAAAALLAALVAFVATDARRAADWRDDLTLFRRTIVQSERAEIIRVNLAVRLHALGRYEEGIRVLEELVSFAPHYRGAWYNLGLLYQSAGRPDDAIAAYRRARHDNPRDTSSLLNLGYLLDQRGRREEATRTYFRLIALDPDHPTAWYNLAVVALEEGQAENARLALRKVLAISPDDTQARALLEGVQAERREPRRSPETQRRCEEARRDLEAGRPAVAVAKLRTAAWFDEQAPLPEHYLANLYYLRGDLETALQHQRRAAELAPEEELYRQNLRALERAVQQQGNGSTTETPTARKQ